MSVQVRRVYDDPSGDDGHRVLVDRLWPRGVAKADLEHDEWCKDAAPSAGLRTELHRGDLSFDGFRRRYRDELAQAPAADAVDRLRSSAKEHGTLTLLTATKDEDHNHALVLAEVLQGDD